MGIENIMLSEWEQPDKNVCVMWFYSYEVLEETKIIHGGKNQNTDYF